MTSSNEEFEDAGRISEEKLTLEYAAVVERLVRGYRLQFRVGTERADCVDQDEWLRRKRLARLLL